MAKQILKNGTIVEHKSTMMTGVILNYQGKNFYDYYEVEWIDGGKTIISRDMVTKTKLKKVGS